MSHCDEGVLHAMLDGEIESSELEPIRRHLATCAPCRARLEECRKLRQEAFGLIETLEVPEPALPDRPMELATPMYRAASLRAMPAPAPIAAAHPAEAPIKEVTPIARRRPRWPLTLAWAATVLLSVGIGYYSGLRRSPRDGSVLADFALAAKEAASDGREGSKQSATAAGPASAVAPTPGATPAPASPAPAEPTTESLEAQLRRSDRADRPQPKTLGKLAKDADEKRVEADQKATEQMATERKKEAEPAAAAPPSAVREETRDLAANRARSLADSVPGRTSQLVARKAAPLGEMMSRAGLRARQAPEPARVVSADEAIRVLGGAIRLVDGLQPDRYEVTGSMVRVIYRLIWGDLVLEQYREGTELKTELTAPPTAPTDSLAAWRARIK